jgi:hypothetical protein
MHPCTPNTRSKASLCAALALAALGSVGCTTTSALELQPAEVKVQHRLAGTVRVEAKGSGRRGGIGPRAITADDLAAAQRGTLLGSSHCDGVVEQGSADHVLRVEVIDLWGSELQLDMEASLSARWTLLDGEGRVAVWQELVKTRGKATTFDSGMVEERAQMALEAAARKNIEEGFARLGRVMHQSQAAPGAVPPSVAPGVTPGNSAVEAAGDATGGTTGHN